MDNWIGSMWFDSVGKIKFKFIYKYDKKGNRIEATMYNADGDLEYKHIDKYNDEGHITNEIRYKVKEDSDKLHEIPTSEIIWEYEFYPEAGE